MGILIGNQCRPAATKPVRPGNGLLTQTSSHLDLHHVVFRRTRGEGDGRQGEGEGEKKKIKKYRVERSTFSTPISPLLFFSLPFPSFQIFDVRKTIPISGSRETGLRTENPYVKFLGRGREGERSFPLHGRLLPTSSFDHHPPPPYPSMRSRDLRGSQGVVNAEERVTTQRRVAEKNIGRKFAGGKRFLGYESRES